MSKAPNTKNLDLWISEGVRQAQNKRQRKLSQKFKKEYEDLKNYAAALEQKINELEKD